MIRLVTEGIPAEYSLCSGGSAEGKTRVPSGDHRDEAGSSDRLLAERSAGVASIDCTARLHEIHQQATG